MRLFARSWLLVPLSLLACGPAAPDPVAPQPAPPAATWGGATTCSAKSEADLMGWDAGSRANIAVLRRQGVLAVRYSAADPCKIELELLPDCIGSGQYVFAPYPATDKRVVHDRTELGAKLPLFSADLSGKLSNGKALRTDFDLAGVMALPAGTPYSRRELHGQGCARATHVVGRIYLGGFSMMVGESRSIEAAVSIFGAGASGSQVHDAESLATEGSADACLAAQRSGTESPLCAVPLRVGLLGLNEATNADYTNGGGGTKSLDEHGCTRGKQVWNGRTCDDLKLDPNGHEILDSLRLNK